MQKPAELKTAPLQAARSVAPVSVAIATAVKALHDGTAEPHQQQMALQWIIREAAFKAHFPMQDNDRDTTFALGRQFVADQIIGLFNADLSSLRRDQNVS